MSDSEYSNDDGSVEGNVSVDEQSEEEEVEASDHDSDDSDGSSNTVYGIVSYVDKKVFATGCLKMTNHDNTDGEVSAVCPIGNSFLKSTIDWRLRDTLCVRCEDKSFFNVVFTFSEGRDKDHVQLAVCVQKCPEATQVSFRRIRMRYCRVKIKLLGRFGGPIMTKFIHVDHDCSCNLLDHLNCDISSAYNSSFLPKTTLKSLCTRERIIGDKEDTEYVIASVSAEILFSKPLFAHSTPDCDKSNVPLENPSFSYIDLKRPATSQNEADTWIKKLRKDSSFTDITFKVGPLLNQGFGAHKCILAARSPVFAAMFQSNMKEANSGEIELNDVEATAMQSFLHSIYETDVAMFEGNVKKNLDVLLLAHKYQIDDVVEGCTQNLVNIPVEEIPIKAAFEIYSTGFKLGIPDLEFKALQCIRANKKQLNCSAGKAILQNFLESDSTIAATLFLGVLLS